MHKNTYLYSVKRAFNWSLLACSTRPEYSGPVSSQLKIAFNIFLYFYYLLLIFFFFCCLVFSWGFQKAKHWWCGQVCLVIILKDSIFKIWQCWKTKKTSWNFHYTNKLRFLRRPIQLQKFWSVWLDIKLETMENLIGNTNAFQKFKTTWSPNTFVIHKLWT